MSIVIPRTAAKKKFHWNTVKNTLVKGKHENFLNYSKEVRK